MKPWYYPPPTDLKKVLIVSVKSNLTIDDKANIPSLHADTKAVMPPRFQLYFLSTDTSLDFEKKITKW